MAENTATIITTITITCKTLLSTFPGTLLTALCNPHYQHLRESVTVIISI